MAGMEKKDYHGIRMEVAHFETKDEVMRDGISLGSLPKRYSYSKSVGDNVVASIRELVNKYEATLKTKEEVGLFRLH